MLFYNKDFDKVTFIANQRHIFAVDLHEIDLDNDNNFDEDDPDTIIHVRLVAWHSECENRKVFKKNNNWRINGSSMTS